MVDVIASASAQRRCPNCGSTSPIREREALWPAYWTCQSCKYRLPEASGFPLLAPHLDKQDVGMTHESFHLLEQVEAGHFWFISRNELITWLVRRFADGAKRVLEIGCGTGFALYALKDALPRATIAGSELHSQGLEIARNRHGGTVELFQMDARISGLANAFDLVGAFDVLEHIPGDDDVLAEIHNMLRPGGSLIATVPQHKWMWSTADDLALHQRRYRLGELARKAKTAGFDVCYTDSFVTLAFPLMMGARLAEKMSRNKKSLKDLHAQQFEISPRANAALLKLARLEHKWRQLRLPLPFGGSQIVVARKPLR